ncbi:MAG: lipoyl synthase [Syntrophales bacterium]|nr:lipoyl synthase [Syntrophales bacterium]
MTQGIDQEPEPSPYLRKPPWLKVRLPGGGDFNRVRDVLSGRGLHSVCQEARCPNMTECFRCGTATFLILGNICTRNCLYCHVAHGAPLAVDGDEPERLVEAVRQLGLRYIVITSVTRDDLPDGGAAHFATCIGAIRRELPASRVEVLIPDLMGSDDALRVIIAAGPDVINHNMEVVPALFKALRPQGDYERSLELLRRIHGAGMIAKSGFMIGFGEQMADIEGLLTDLSRVHCGRITVGQYQQPTAHHWPVKKYYHPDEFAAIGDMARALGFDHVESDPLVRSSYHAERCMEVTNERHI